MLTAPAIAADPNRGTELSVFGDLKYAAGFMHFDYVNPDAPKGGAIKIPGLDTFETLHPFILKGRKELLAEPLLFDTLMARSTDEPDSYYGLVVKTVEVPDDKSWVAFNINPQAKFHDGMRDHRRRRCIHLQYAKKRRPPSLPRQFHAMSTEPKRHRRRA